MQGKDILCGHQLARLIIEMVGNLHDQGYESLYINPIMSPNGCYWRYEIGTMLDGQWPYEHLPSQKDIPLTFPRLNGHRVKLQV